jgi:Fe2+ or Zn2+ uptake regulation protein
MNDLLERVRAMGHRLTAPRRAVLEVLARERAHLTPESSIVVRGGAIPRSGW